MCGDSKFKYSGKLKYDPKKQQFLIEMEKLDFFFFF